MMLRFLFLLPFLWACSDKHAGGPSSVETQNSIAGTIFLPNGTPGGNAKLSLYHADMQTDTPLEESQSDDSGFFEFKVPDQGLYSIVVETNSGYSGRLLKRASTIAPEIPDTLESQCNVTIHLSPGSFGENSALLVKVLGTNINLPWNSSSSLTLDLPAKGVYNLEILLENESRLVPILVNADSQEIEIAPRESIGFTLLDMEQSCYQNNLMTLLGESWNFLIDGNDINKPSGTTHDMKESCELDGSQGKVLHASFVPTHEASWFLFGTGFGDSEIGANLSAMDSLVFLAKGTCEMDVGFITEDMHEFEDYRYAQTTRFTLSDTWVRYSFSASTFLYPENSEAYRKKFTWEKSSSQTLFIQWSTYQECEFWLDEVQLIGLQYSDLIIRL